MKLRVFSDIHLDHFDGRFNAITGKPVLWYPKPLPDDKETTLILAGDLWIGTRFIEFAGYSWIQDIANQFKEVFIVLGNHDYWPGNHSLTIVGGGDKCNGMLQDCGLFNVHVLNMDTIIRDDYLFVGCTLWTDMKRGDPLIMYNMPQFMRYDGKIGYEHFTNGEGFTRFSSQKWVDTHAKHRDYIKHVAHHNPDKKIVVITHHIPLTHLGDPSYINDESSYYYFSDLNDLILDNPNIVGWFFGHSHVGQDEIIGNTRLYSNPVGYVGEHREQYNLVKHEVIEI